MSHVSKATKPSAARKITAAVVALGLMSGAATIATIATAHEHRGEHSKAKQAKERAPKTRAMVEERARAHFSKLDTDSNGSLSRAEVEAMQAKVKAKMAKMQSTMHDKMFSKMDKDGDGNISRDEFGMAHLEMVEKRIIRHVEDKEAADEAVAAIRQAKREIRTAHGEMNRAMHKTRKEMRSLRRQARRMDFDRLDKNDDGQVSFAEFSARALKRFDRMDADKDGVISSAEYAQAREKRKAHRHARAESRRKDS